MCTDRELDMSLYSYLRAYEHLIFNQESPYSTTFVTRIRTRPYNDFSRLIPIG